MSKGKKTLKVILWILISLLLIAGGLTAWLLFGGGGNRNALTVIPKDAVYIIETNDLTEGYNTLTGSKIWKHMLSNPRFAEINASAMQLDSLINGNKTLDMLFSGRQLVISAHMITATDYDFIFAVDLKKSSKISFLRNYIRDIVSYFDFSFQKREYNGNEIIELVNTTSGEILSLCFVENVMVCSFSPVLIQKSLDQKESKYWIDHPDVRFVSAEISSGKLFSFYINFSMLDDFLRCYLDQPGDFVNSLSSNLLFSAFNVSIEDERLEWTGYTSINDSLPSYFKALSQIPAGKWKAWEVISDRAALYVSMSFANSSDFFGKLREVFNAEDTTRAQNYEKTIRKVEKYLRISIEDDFFAWVGNEIAFVKLEPSANAREEDALALIHASDVEQARSGMDKITRNIRKKTLGLIKFDDTDYKGFTITYLNYGWFLKLFFGKLFSKFDKPYYTIIEDYVVFSNSSSCLMDFIDDYTVGKTLAHEKTFTEFAGEFNNKASISVFVQMPKIYSHLYYYSKADKRRGIRENRDLILSFTRIGFQMVSDKKLFETRFIAEFDESAAFADELEKMELAAEELFLAELDTGNFVPEIGPQYASFNGGVKLYHADSITIMHEGRLVNGKLEGLWRSYFPGGRIMCAVNYREGIAEGIAYYYFDADKQVTRAEFLYKDGNIEGVYREFYENGNRKARLDFREGVPDGEAEFYYDSGILKIEGRYREGVKEGKWKHYSETGEIIEKEKWKKGNQKK